MMLEEYGDLGLLDLVTIQSWVLVRWKEVVRVAVKRAHRQGLGPGYRIRPDLRLARRDALILYAHVGMERAELALREDEWGLTDFDELQPRVQCYLASIISERTPPDRKGVGRDWRGKLYGFIKAKGYVPPVNNGMIWFMYDGQGPYRGGTTAHSLLLGHTPTHRLPDWVQDAQ